MKRSRHLLIILVALLVVVGVSWAGYQEGYSWGIYRGYTKGYEAVNSFPRLEMADVTFTQNGNSVYISQITITGEQRIIDTLKNLSNLEGFISFKRGDLKQ